jgi:hypothetical protein
MPKAPTCFGVAGLFEGHAPCTFDGCAERPLVQELGDDHRERCRGLIARWMSVRQLRDRLRETEYLAGDARVRGLKQQPDRRDPHDRSGALLLFAARSSVK